MQDGNEPKYENVKGEVIEDARTGEMIPRGSPPLIPGVLAQININQVGMLDVDEKAMVVLQEELNPKDVLIRPDGLVYLPWTWYANRLNRAFGVLRWALIPQGAPQIKESGNQTLVVWLHWLVVKGTPVSMAGGETSYQPSNYTMSYGDAMEGARSNSLARNCKYMGMALELWSQEWVENWKKQNAETYPNPNQNAKQKFLWRKKGQKSPPKPETAATTPQNQAPAPQNQDLGQETTETTPDMVKAAQEEAVGFSVKELKSAERVPEIKELSGKDIPTIIKLINSLEKDKKYTIGQVVKMLTEEK